MRCELKFIVFAAISVHSKRRSTLHKFQSAGEGKIMANDNLSILLAKSIKSLCREGKLNVVYAMPRLTMFVLRRRPFVLSLPCRKTKNRRCKFNVELRK